MGFLDRTLARIGLQRTEPLAEAQASFPGYDAYRSAIGEAHPTLIWGDPTVGPRNYRNLALNYSAAYRCAVAIANEASRYPLCVYHRDTGKMVKPGIRTAPARLAKLLREGIDPYRSNRTIINMMCFDMAAQGDAFLRIHGSRATPTRLELMQPDGATAHTDPSGAPFFTLTGADGKTSARYPLNEVVHPVLNSLLLGESNRFRGVGPLQAAVASVGVGAAGNEYTLREFSGDSVQAKYLYARPGAMTPEQQAAVEASAKNASRSQGLLILQNMRDKQGNDTRFEALASANIGQSRGLSELKNFSVEDVCRAFGVPPAIAGVKGSQWGSGLVELKKFFLVFGVKPYLDAIADAFTQAFFRGVPEFSLPATPRARVVLSDYEVRFELPSVLATDGDLKTAADVWTQAGDGSAGISRNEWRKMAGLPALPGKEHDEIATKDDVDEDSRERQRKAADDNDPGGPKEAPQDDSGNEESDDERDE